MESLALNIELIGNLLCQDYILDLINIRKIANAYIMF